MEAGDQGGGREENGPPLQEGGGGSGNGKRRLEEASGRGGTEERVFSEEQAAPSRVKGRKHRTSSPVSFLKKPSLLGGLSGACRALVKG